jgi:hypothetical protein
MKPNFENILNCNKDNFNELKNEIFLYQYSENLVYKNWCNHCFNNGYNTVNSGFTPFLPISFFKTHHVYCGNNLPPFFFESSGTTQHIQSKHFYKSTENYLQSCTQQFQLQFGNIDNLCILGLLPNYLERNNASLVCMVDHFINLSTHKNSGFYLYNHQQLFDVLQQLEKQQQPTILFGVTFAILDFADNFSIPLQYTKVIDTGGMKGRKKELTTAETHAYI